MLLPVGGSVRAEECVYKFSLNSTRGQICHGGKQPIAEVGELCVSNRRTISGPPGLWPTLRLHMGHQGILGNGFTLCQREAKK